MGKLGPPSVRLFGRAAIKTGDEHPIETALLDGPAFAPSRQLGERRRIFLRGQPAEPTDLPEALDLLRVHVWPRTRLTLLRDDWRDALIEHLRRIYPSPRLLEEVAALPPVRDHVMIHGDATAANLLRYPRLGLRWIDPMHRRYVPGDPLVDVGKCLQSCWGYEDVLVGRRPSWNVTLADRLFSALSDRDGDVAMTWLRVHLARLLRYHDDRVRLAFEEVLVDEYECRICRSAA